MTTLRPLLALILLAGCHTPPAHTPTVTAGPPAHVGCPVAPDTEGECSYESTGLPALTTDGKLVLHAEQDEDGGRGAPNFRVVARRVADDSVAGELLVEPAVDERIPAADRDANLDKANAALALLPATALTLYPRDCEQDGGEPGCRDKAQDAPLTASVGPLVVAYGEPKLRVTRDGKVLLEQDMPAWSAPPQGSGEDACTNPAHLGGVWADVGRGVLLVKISYSGTDSCWEPSSSYHVVKLP